MLFQKGPATGEALAQLILDGRVDTVDITPFDPARSVLVLLYDNLYLGFFAS